MLLSSRVVVAAGESYWEYRDWKTEALSSDKYRYTTNGQVRE